MKVAFLGCGRVAEHYRKMLLEVDPVERFEVVAVCDLDITKASRLAQAFNCRMFDDLDNMLLAESIDVLFVLTPSGDHYDHAKLALKNGVNVVCEKPITMIPGDAKKLNEIALSKGLFCSTVFQNRWNPALRAAKDAVTGGRLKKLITLNIRLQWCRLQEYYEDGWHGTWAKDGGVINQQAIHHIDALQWIGGAVESVCATATRRMNHLEAEDTLVAIVRFKNGALGTIEATTAARPKDFEAAISIVGEGGKIQIGGIAMNKIDQWDLVDDTESDQNIIERCSIDVPTGYGLSHSLFMRELVEHYEGRLKPNVTIESASKTLNLVHAIYVSVETGSWVNLDDERLSSNLGRAS